MEERGIWPGGENSEFPIWGTLHTHPPGSGAFWSGTDNETLVFSNLGAGLLVSIVLQPHKNEWKGRVDARIQRPGGQWGEKLFWCKEIDSDFYIEEPFYPGMEDEVTAVVKEKWSELKTKVVSVTRSGNRSGAGYCLPERGGGASVYPFQGWQDKTPKKPQGKEKEPVVDEADFECLATLSDLAYDDKDGLMIDLTEDKVWVTGSGHSIWAGYESPALLNWWCAVFPDTKLGEIKPRGLSGKLLFLYPRKKIGIEVGGGQK